MKNSVLFCCFLCQFFFSSLFAQTNYAISMNGNSNSYASLGTVNPMNNFSTGLTIECWVKWGAFNNWSRLLDMGNGDASDNILFANEGSSNNLRFEVYRGGSQEGLSGPANLVTGRWYHVAVTLNGSGTATLYVDVVAVASGAVWLPNNVSRVNSFIGRSNWAGDAYLNGVVDNLRIWNVARTQQELKSNMFKDINPSSPGIVASYSCNENGGAVLLNGTSGGGAGNGTVDAGLTWTASPIQFATNALNFDGADDYAVIPHIVNGDFTVEYWMRTTATGSGGYGSQWYGGNGIVDAEVPGGTNDWGTSLTGQYLAFGIGNPDITIHSTTIVNTGNWVHVAASWQQSTGVMRLYINGVEEASSVGSTSLRTAPTRITIGQLQTNMQRFAGSIDEVRIWNVVRTPAQILANMSVELDPAGAGTTNMAAYYTFNQNSTAGVNSGVVTVIDQKSTNNATLYNFSLSGSSSNFVEQQASFSTLPVELLSFTAAKINSNVHLVWKTATEQNAFAFFVERSADGHNWSSIAQLPAVGNSNSVQQYSYTDATALSGQNFYRLRQVDNDGKQVYSEVKQVRFSNAASSIVMLGNPVMNGQLTIQWNDHQSVRAGLYGARGELLITFDLKQGMNAVNVSQLKPGMYWLRTATESKKLYCNNVRRLQRIHQFLVGSMKRLRQETFCFYLSTIWLLFL
jgi:hypothetical protein